MGRRKWGLDELLEAMDGAETTKDILLRLGLKISGGNYATIRDMCEEHGLTRPSTSKVETVKAAQAARRFPIETILVENSTYTDRSRIKVRLVNEGLLEYECEACGIQDSWNGCKLVLQLDHKNGVKNDHRLSNLQFLCPNCHSQTDTFSGRNARRSSEAVGA